MMKDDTELAHLHQHPYHWLEFLSKEKLIDSEKLLDLENESWIIEYPEHKLYKNESWIGYEVSVHGKICLSCLFPYIYPIIFFFYVQKNHHRYQVHRLITPSRQSHVSSSSLRSGGEGQWCCYIHRGSPLAHECEGWQDSPWTDARDCDRVFCYLRTWNSIHHISSIRYHWYYSAHVDHSECDTV